MIGLDATELHALANALQALDRLPAGVEFSADVLVSNGENSEIAGYVVLGVNEADEIAYGFFPAAS